MTNYYWNSIQLSENEIANERISYETVRKYLTEVIGSGVILNNNIVGYGDWYDWDIESGELTEDDEIFQYFIIDDWSARWIEENMPNEIIYYNSKIDMSVWGICHFGTNWRYVYTEISTKSAIKVERK